MEKQPKGIKKPIPLIPEFLAILIEDWKKEAKERKLGFFSEFSFFIQKNEVWNWLDDSDYKLDLLTRAYIWEYRIEEKTKYLIKIKASEQYLYLDRFGKLYFAHDFRTRTPLTKTFLDREGFSWIFNCDGVEIIEVE